MRGEAVSTLYATERLRNPYALDGVVVNDLPLRSLSVRLPDTASGYQRLWWKQAWLQLRATVEDGWQNHPFVWASTPSAYQVAHVQPGGFSNIGGELSTWCHRLLGVDLQTRPGGDCDGRPQHQPVYGREVSQPPVSFSPEALAAAMAKVPTTLTGGRRLGCTAAL